MVLLEQAADMAHQAHMINMSYKEELAREGERSLRVSAKQVQKSTDPNFKRKWNDGPKGRRREISNLSKKNCLHIMPKRQMPSGAMLSQHMEVLLVRKGKHKARLVLLGNQQTSMAPSEKCSPVVQRVNMNMIITITLQWKMEDATASARTQDKPNCFAQTRNDREEYMTLPQDIEELLDDEEMDKLKRNYPDWKSGQRLVARVDGAIYGKQNSPLLHHTDLTTCLLYTSPSPRDS
mgnify:CR=1 FL=1